MSSDSLIASSASQQIAAIVLAAGGSSRLGYSKQLISFHGEALVRRAAQAALDANANPVVVVLGADADMILIELKELTQITTCINTEWQSGLASSLRFGLSALRKLTDVDGFLVTLADQPLVTAESLRMLMEAFDNDHRLAAAEYDGVIGVPAIFGREYLDDLMQITGDAGAGAWLRARSSDVTRIPLGECGVDIDTPDDVTRLGMI